jgi:hypothetical protein
MAPHTDYLEQMAAQGWARVEVAPGEWVAVVPNETHTAFGGTLWRQADDGHDYAEGVTEGYPISAALDYEAAARAIAVGIKREAGE